MMPTVPYSETPLIKLCILTKIHKLTHITVIEQSPTKLCTNKVTSTVEKKEQFHVEIWQLIKIKFVLKNKDY
jgi:hypothetical protein